MPRRIYYKATSKERKSTSAKGELKLYYPKGEKVEAPEGTLGIFVSKTKREARDHAGGEGNVIKCHGHGRARKIKFMISPFKLPNTLFELLKALKYKSNLSYNMYDYQETVLFDAITCIE